MQAAVAFTTIAGRIETRQEGGNLNNSMCTTHNDFPLHFKLRYETADTNQLSEINASQ